MAPVADAEVTEKTPKHEMRMSKQIHHSNGSGSSTRGQALIETVIALVALLAVFAALVQVARLGRARTEAMMEARREAGQNALSAEYAQPMPDPVFIYNWEVGDDGRSYSADDTVRGALSGTVDTDLLAPAHPAALAARRPGNALSNLQGLNPVVTGFDFVHGRAQSERIDLMPVVRHLLYDAENIQITADAWLTWTQEVP